MTEFFRALVSSGLVMGALTMVFLLILPFCQKRYRAGTLYLISVILALGFLIPFRPHGKAPAVTVYAPAALSQPMGGLENPTQADIRPHSPLAARNDISSEERGSYTSPFSSRQRIPTLWDALMLVWLTGAAVLLLFHGLRHARFLRICKRWQSPVSHPETIAIFSSLCHRYCPGANVQLMVCPAINSPMLVGFSRPKVLLPDEELSPEELEVVLLHELVHLRRKDLWVKAGLLFTAILNWFNPAAWLLLRWAVFTQEAACDEQVTAHANHSEKIFYSETILRVIRRRSRLASALTTSFYGGKNTMKRRITAIIAGGTRLGGTLATSILLLTLLTGVALGIQDALPAENAASFAPGQTVYLWDAQRDGTRLLSMPSANDWPYPVALYFNGTPSTILEVSEGGACLPEWGMEEKGLNWIQVAIGGDGGLSQGMLGWIPACFLSAQKPAAPTATVTLVGDENSGHVNLYKSFGEESGLLSLRTNGETAVFLGRTRNWLHLQLEDTIGFVQANNAAYEKAIEAALETFEADTYENISYEEYRLAVFENHMFQEKTALYGTANIESWPMEGKAWFSQFSKITGGGFDSQEYRLPGENDLPEDTALELAWEEYLRQTNLPALSKERFVFTTGFYSRYVDPPELTQWEVLLSHKQKGGDVFRVELSNPGGEILFAGSNSVYQSAYPQGDAISQKQKQQLNALVLWEAERGPYPFWNPEDKAAFSQEYAYGHYTLPEEGAISSADAIARAKEALMTEYRYTQEEAESWLWAAAYSHEENSSLWLIYLYDQEVNLLGTGTVDPFDGSVLHISDPAATSHG